MRTIALLLITSLMLASCAHDYHNPSVEASNGMYGGAVGAPVIRTAAGGLAVGNPAAPLAEERARKAEAWNKLPQ